MKKERADKFWVCVKPSRGLTTLLVNAKSFREAQEKARLGIDCEAFGYEITWAGLPRVVREDKPNPTKRRKPR